MWFLGIFGKAALGMWRLLVGMAIGIVLYVYMFFEHKEIWLKIEEASEAFMKWLVTFPQLTEYSNWSSLLNLDDKLAFAMYILVGRIIWLIFEGAVITFPVWLWRRSMSPQPDLQQNSTNAVASVVGPRTMEYSEDMAEKIRQQQH